MHATTTVDETRQLQLDGALSIYTAADTKPRLSAALQGAIALEIDLSGIEEFDCAGLQLLLATREQARRQDIDLRLLGANAVVRELLALSGLGDALIAPEAN
ncbi:lipid asymmetry maintenance protein MlaB [Ectopseudomonas composti]|jgi:anti-sigma B factor antagonist|uniref:STAS domain-containing protein n=1 Tax=Ectopseudomonas composti TaxID=658457 RepID=UPI00077308B3|nr:STAS domain-containing protein [Pseudomonas composti]